MRIYITTLLILILLSCRQTPKTPSFSRHVPNDIKIIYKTIAFDTSWSKNLVSCEDIPEELNTIYGCIIRKGTEKYIRKYTLFYNKSYDLDSVFRYTPMGVDLHDKTEFINYPQVLPFKVRIKNTVSINFDKGAILDNGDTLPIIDYWKEEKLLFVSRDQVDTSELPRYFTLIYGTDK